jgi:hypothetical protein
MNPELTPEECVACLEILYRGLVQIRLAAMDGNAQRAEAIADALHNLPHLLSVGHERGWDVATFAELFLEPLADRYPDLAGLSQPLDELP